MTERFGALKKDNIISVFNASLDKIRTSRTELSSITDLSFVTVSKICDELISLDILKQSFTTDKSAIRRSRILNVKFKYYIGVYTFEPDLFTFSICDLSLRCIHTFSYIPANDIFIDDSVRKFIKFAENFGKQKARNCICCATGILVPGEYDPDRDTVRNSPIPHFSSIYIKQIFEGKTFDTAPVIRSMYTSYCMEAQKDISDEDKVFALFLNKNDLKSAYFDISTEKNISLNNTGILTVCDNSNYTLGKICETSPDPSILFPRLADIIFTLMNTVKVTKITLSGSLYTRMDAASSVLNNELSRLCNKHSIIPPEICNINIRSIAMKNIAREIRNKWFIEKILEEDSP